ncbi:MAG: translocation/assembly module TamB domain-containing protein [Pseudomonadales bacterium]|nr:translocation/assembly module TamB domain-containing protein [Pseudomonadales bacterium]
MSRLWWQLLTWLVALPLLAVLSMPFTETGSRLLVDQASRFLPMEIEYGGGTLAGELRVEHLAWSGDSVRLELRGTVLQLVPNCLWNSEICFAKLHARQLDVTLLPDPGSEPDEPGDGDEGLFEFPVPLETGDLQLDGLSVQWDGGQWSQGQLRGAVRISGSTIDVERALVLDSRLDVTGGDDTGPGGDGSIVLPEIYLPLDLRVGKLVLERGQWSLNGSTGQFDELQLHDSQWQATELRVGDVQLRAPALGAWRVAATLDFSGQWPLSGESDGQLPAIEGWPDTLGHSLAAMFSGDLAALTVEADVSGEISLSADILLNALDPALPFRIAANAESADGAVAVSELAAVPESLASMELASPVQLHASGSLHSQVFQIETSLNGLGYQAVGLLLGGSHEAGRLVLEDLRLGEAKGANTLWGKGELEYAEHALQWSVVLESSGLDLSPLGDFGAGHVEGKLQLRGEVEGEQWSISVLKADLDGTLYELPARLTGYGGIDSQLRLLPGELKAEVNGARLQLAAPEDQSLPARLDIAIDDLGAWQESSRGSLALQARLVPGWSDFSFTGALSDIEWQGVEIASAKLTGSFRPQDAAKIDLEVALTELALGTVDLETAQFSAHGDSSALALALRVQGDVDGVLELAGEFDGQGAWSGQLAATTLQTSAGNWYLQEPVDVSYSPSPQAVRLAAHCWGFGKSTVCPGATLLGEQGSTSLAIDGDLETLAAWLPEYLQIQGVITGQFFADWSPGQALNIEGESSIRDILLTRQFGAGEAGRIAWQRIDSSVRNGAQGLVLSADASSGDGRILNLDLHLPAERDQQLEAAIEVVGLRLRTLAPLAPAMSELDGELSGRLRLYGTFEQPLADGELTLADGHFALLGNPTELQQLELRLEAQGDQARVRGQGMLGGGQLNVDGAILSRPEWGLQLVINGDHHEILLPPYTSMRVSEQLEMTINRGLLALKGEVVVHEGELEHEQLPEGGVALSDDVVEVDLEGGVIYEAAPFDISVNVGLLIEDNFRILGEMVNAVVGGDLQLRQEPRQPLQVFGNLNVIGGELRAYQQHLRIQRGTVSFAGTPENPELDVRAQREIATNNVIVGLQMQGTLEQPKLEVFSEPVMSHGEAMSYLIRGRGLDAGAGTDGVAMALSLGTGLVNRTAVVDQLNQIPGISNLSFGAEGTTEEDTAATVGGYIGERLYLSYGMGIYEPINVLTARLFLQSRLWLEVVSRLENSVDLYYSFDIE